MEDGREGSSGQSLFNRLEGATGRLNTKIYRLQSIQAGPKLTLPVSDAL